MRKGTVFLELHHLLLVPTCFQITNSIFSVKSVNFKTKWWLPLISCPDTEFTSFLDVLGLRCCLGFSLVAVCRLFTAVASLVVEHGLHGVWASVIKAHGLIIVVAPGLYSTGSIVVAHGLNYRTSCGIFLDQGQTCVPCNSRWILSLWNTKEALNLLLTQQNSLPESLLLF